MYWFTLKASSFILTKEEAAPEKKTTKKGFHDTEMLEQPPEPVRDLKSTFFGNSVSTYCVLVIVVYSQI